MSDLCVGGVLAMLWTYIIQPAMSDLCVGEYWLCYELTSYNLPW